MKIKNMLFYIFFLCAAIPCAYAATGHIYNFTGRDLFIRPFWWDPNYIKIAAGQKFYFDSGLREVQDIEWITDATGNDTWKKYTTQGLKLAALKTSKEFRIYPEGKYEENFMFNWVRPKDNMLLAQPGFSPEYIVINGKNRYLRGEMATFLVVENSTNNMVFFWPPVTQFLPEDARRGFISEGYDCIPLQGSKIYSIFNNARNTIDYVSRNNAGQWLEYSQSVSTLEPGKIMILPDGSFKYKMWKTGKLVQISPPGKPTKNLPDCQLAR